MKNITLVDEEITIIFTSNASLQDFILNNPDWKLVSINSGLINASTGSPRYIHLRESDTATFKYKGSEE